MLDVGSQCRGVASTNLGRFALMGKETAWTIQTNVDLSEAFRIATLLQIIILRKDADTIEHFAPIEIGGSGAYYDNPKVVEARHDLSLVRDEIRYRIN
jgi:hypothetical protein